jgi:predicted transcriptional regulator
MQLADIKEFLKCQIISQSADLDIDIDFAYASDLMSDVLLLARPGALLLTGLANNQTIRTGKIAASSAIIFVRGKKPPDAAVKLAAEYKIPILATELSMFDACGILFSNGIKGIPIKK